MPIRVIAMRNTSRYMTKVEIKMDVVSSGWNMILHLNDAQ